MKKLVLKNGIKVIYKKIEGEITSFSIALNAGALEDDGAKKGLAHVVEHMVSKGTKNRTEQEINMQCDELFGFENAMTNYPYVIYYATCLSADLENAFELYSDILLNPTFPEKGFKEEINIIKEELKEWKDDINQYCEDELLFNSFKNRRIKDLIIGNEESLNSITLEDVRNFYNKYYCPENMVISVVSFVDFEFVIKHLEKYFGSFSRKFQGIEEEYYEDNKSSIFTKVKENIEGAKIQFLFPIHDLSNREVDILRLFNVEFGEGTSSILFDEVRTKNGLVYDISTRIDNSRGIKLFYISMACSKENVSKCIDLVNNKIEELKNCSGYFTKDKMLKLCRRLKFKRALALEQSIRLSMQLALYEIMYGNANKVFDEVKGLENIKEKEIVQVIIKVFQKPSIQILQPK